MTESVLEAGGSENKEESSRSAPPSSMKPFSSPAPQDESEPENFQFTGTGSEYFRIWVVNLLLTMATLGIYSAWAKVRRQQYFYRNTRVAGAAFDYLGTPMAILKGRLIAFGMFAIYNIAFAVSPEMAAVVGLVLVAMMPWLLVRALRFRMSNSAYRNVRFHFRGTVGQAYRMFIVFPAAFILVAATTWVLLIKFQKNEVIAIGVSVLTVLAYVAIAPLMHYLLKRYQHGNAYLGRMPFSFKASATDFFKVYAIAIVCMVLGLIALSVSVAATGTVHRMTENPLAGFLGGLYIVLGFYVFYMFFIAYFEGKIQNLVWNKTAATGIRFESRIKISKLLFIHATNLLLIFVTLGLYKPFAAVRRIKYRVECMTLIPLAGSLESVLADHTNELVGATGEEAGDMFDLDIAL